MNRTDRLLAIVLELQGRGHARAEDLARTLEVSKRTIYRDVLALNETGVPIVSTPGRGYHLMAGYFLPPLRFSTPEAVMLTLGLDMVRGAFDEEYARAAQDAARKITAALTDAVRDDARFLRESLKLVIPDEGGPRDTLRALRGAILARRSTRFTYRKPGGKDEARQVDPHGLFRYDRTWMLAAYDHVRRDFRTFRLDRMGSVHVTDAPFERQPNFRLERDETREDRDTTVRVLVTAPPASRPAVPKSYFVTDQHDTPQGLLITLRVRRVEDVLSWVLAWGSAVTVLEPAELRGRVRAEAAAILASDA